MPATPTVNPTRAALEAAVLDLTDEQIASALCKVDRVVKGAYEERADYAWPREAQLSLLARWPPGWNAAGSPPRAERPQAGGLAAAGRPSSYGCSTMATTREERNRAVRTGCPVRVTSATSTMVREVVTSTRRPERVATISNPRTLPLPVSTSTSTLSPRIPGSLAAQRRAG